MTPGSAVMTEQRTMDVTPQQMLAEGRKVPSVADALRVFELASKRAPMMAPAQPIVRVSTGANL